MIRDLKSDGNDVVIVLEYKHPIKKYTTTLKATFNSEIDSILRADNLSKNLHETIEKIRKLEYESGWSDAKKKKAKRTYFYNSMTTNNYQ